MPSTFGQWLIVILALVLGGAGGWVARGRQAAATAERPEPMVEGDPVVGLSEEEKAAATVTATVDTPQPAATVDVAPAPAAVIDAPTPHDLDATPAAASLAASHTPLTADDDTAASDTVAGPVDVAASGADGAADRTDALDAGDDRTDVAVEADEERTVEPVGVAPSDPGTTATAHEVDAEAVAPAAPVEAPAPAEVEAAGPVIPAPRRALEDEAPVASDEPATTDAAIVATPDAETADDFRRIQGVGPKMAAALQAAGIRTYRQLAELDEAALRETIRAAGLRAAPSLATWPQQAKLLAGAGAEAGAVLPEPAADQA
ncbi:helix-hairpin-helix domain-containing protein [Micromonospora purpureochromogenes]|uniref:helix-hairpin-helix domain-containing protein n=1 Tax=Micromonospora purpureochromogenes TaxID=47872 RepID=UPI0033C4C461